MTLTSGVTQGGNLVVGNAYQFRVSYHECDFNSGVNYKIFRVRPWNSGTSLPSCSLVNEQSIIQEAHEGESNFNYWNWTPTTAGNFAVYCADINVGYGACSPFKASCDTTYDSACPGPSAYMIWTVVTKDNTPTGWFDGASCTNGIVNVTGWSCDGDNWSQALNIYVYSDGNSIGSGVASIPAEQAVADLCGGTYNHRFNFNATTTVTPGTHTINVYTQNISSGTVLLGGSPKTVTCPGYACSSNANCDDGNYCTWNVCVNPGTYSSYCSYPAITCDDGNSCTTNNCDGSSARTTCTGGPDGYSSGSYSCGCYYTNVPVNGSWTCNTWGACGGASCGGTGTQTCTAGTCPATCGGTCGAMPTRSCSMPACVCYNNSGCNDSNSCTTDVCVNPGTNNAFCTNTNVPVNGTWTYTAWGACGGASCGGTGTQTRSTVSCSATCGGTCGTPVTSQSCTMPACTCYNNSGCNDNNSCTTDVCVNPGTNNAFCTNTNVPVNGTWTYGVWGACSGGPCGGTGTQTRSTISCSATCGGTCGTPVTSQSCTMPSCAKGTLTVIKSVVNNNGGTKIASNFTITVTGSGPSPSSFAGAASPGTAVTMDAGTYSANEIALSGYTKSLSIDCSGTMASGAAKTCTITNDDQAATLKVIKSVVNNNGGTKIASNFTINVTATSASPSSFAGAASPGTTVTLSAGAYSVDETAVAGYTKTLSSGCSGTIANGSTVTCTITNDDTAPSTGMVTVIKSVINNNGGTKIASNFTINVTGSSPSPASFVGAASPGTTVTLNPGVYSVDETAVAGYTKTLSSGCSGTMTAGSALTCTITNDDIAPLTGTLTVIKNVINNNGGIKVANNFAITVTGSSPSPASFVGAASPGTTVTLNPGVYSVDETAVSGYAKTLSAGCSGTIAAGSTNTCTITNDDIATAYKVNVTVYNADGADASCSSLSQKEDGVAVRINARSSPANSYVLLSSGVTVSGTYLSPDMDTAYNDLLFDVSKTSFQGACTTVASYMWQRNVTPSGGGTISISLAIQHTPVDPWTTVVNADVFAPGIPIPVPASPSTPADNFSYYLIDSISGSAIGGFALSNGFPITTSLSRINKPGLGGYAKLPSSPSHNDVALSSFTFDPPSSAVSKSDNLTSFTAGSVYKMSVTTFNSLATGASYTVSGNGVAILYITGSTPDVTIGKNLQTSSTNGRVLIISKPPVKVAKGFGTASPTITTNPNVMAGIIAYGNITVENDTAAYDNPIILSTPFVSKGSIVLNRDLGSLNLTYPAQIIVNNYSKYLYDITNLERSKKDSMNYTGLRTFDVQFVYQD